VAGGPQGPVDHRPALDRQQSQRSAAVQRRVGRQVDADHHHQEHAADGAERAGGQRRRVGPDLLAGLGAVPHLEEGASQRMAVQPARHGLERGRHAGAQPGELCQQAVAEQGREPGQRAQQPQQHRGQRRRAAPAQAALQRLGQRVEQGRDQQGAGQQRDQVKQLPGQEGERDDAGGGGHARQEGAGQGAHAGPVKESEFQSAR
jgi:hypothetical protein